jgi:hypothetical protein
MKIEIYRKVDNKMNKAFLFVIYVLKSDYNKIP